MTNLLKFKFTQLGQRKGPKVFKGLREKHHPSKRIFSFLFFTDKQFYDGFYHLKVNKLQGPSSMQAAALKTEVS